MRWRSSVAGPLGRLISGISRKRSSSAASSCSLIGDRNKLSLLALSRAMTGVQLLRRERAGAGLELQLCQPRVDAVLAHKALVGAFLDDHAMVHHQDAVGLEY